MKGYTVTYRSERDGYLSFEVQAQSREQAQRLAAEQAMECMRHPDWIATEVVESPAEFARVLDQLPF